MKKLLPALLAITVILAVGTYGAQSHAQSAYVGTQKALSAGKKAYNAEEYKTAIEHYARAAQLDPGAKQSNGEPYLNMARAYFWLERYDHAVYWYEHYLKGWPKADGVDGIVQERDAANDRRRKPSKPVTMASVYGDSVVELVGVLRRRLKKKEAALTDNGGGTSRLYFLAIDRGYCAPELLRLSSALKDKLFEEVIARLVTTGRAPIPLRGEGVEPLTLASQRLDLLMKLRLTAEEHAKVASYQRLVNAWQDYDAQRFESAANEFKEAREDFPKLDYLPYAQALALHKAGKSTEASATLEARLKSCKTTECQWERVLHAVVNKRVRPKVASQSYYDVLIAEP